MVGSIAHMHLCVPTTFRSLAPGAIPGRNEHDVTRLAVPAYTRLSRTANCKLKKIYASLIQH